MAKKLIKRFLPHPQKIKDNKYLQIFGKFLYAPNLWYLNRRSVASAASIGLFVTFIPLPGHMILAALVAIYLRANISIALAFAWVVNPLTMVPIYGFAYALGASILGVSLQEIRFESLLELKEVWQPLLLGCFLCGLCLASLGNIAIRVYWRYSVSKNWQRRQKMRTEDKFVAST